MEHVERNQAWADLLRAETSAVWAGFEADRRDGAVTPSDHLGDQPVVRPADPVLRLLTARAGHAGQLPASYLDDLETQRAAVRAERDSAGSRTSGESEALPRDESPQVEALRG